MFADDLEVTDEASPFAFSVVVIADAKQKGRVNRDEDLHAVCGLQDMAPLLRESNRSTHQFQTWCFTSRLHLR
jgi:hypothetical protein